MRTILWHRFVPHLGALSPQDSGRQTESASLRTRVKLALATGVLAMIPGPAVANYLFAPGACEFRVIFPAVPETKTVPGPSGTVTVSAILPRHGYTLSASCSYDYPDGTFAELSDSRIAGFITGIATRIGADETTVQKAESDFGRLFVARMTFAGRFKRT